LPAGTVLLRRLSVLVFTEHGTRRRPAGGVTANPAGEWTVPHAATSPSPSTGGSRTSGSCPGDRGPNFTASLDAVFPATGTKILISAVQAPRMNATCERLIGTLRREVLDRILILGERHLRAVLTEYQVHDNTARPHQGIAPRVPDEEPDVARATLPASTDNKSAENPSWAA
jgi:putative transposase